jgi:hypothetical protein
MMIKMEHRVIMLTKEVGWQASAVAWLEYSGENAC